MDTTIISCSSQKGGVGKTVSCFNLGSALALKHDKKILLIDLDPQANLSEYTPENAREILKHMGKNIDIVAGPYDERALKNWKCAAQFVADVPIRCAVSIYNPLAKKDRLTVDDLHGRSLMLICEGWNEETDRLRKWLTEEHPEINIVTFDFINLSVFNQCENSDNVLMCIDNWSNVHPLLKTLPVDWDFSMQFGLLHAPKPGKTVKRFLSAVKLLKQ